jgi:hypothetical protein
MNNTQLPVKPAHIMKSNLLFFLFLFIFTPTISSGAEIHTMDIEFSFPATDDPAKQLIGYRLYKEGKQVCDADDPATSRITCEMLTEDGTFNFTTTARYSDGTESPPSTSFPFTIISVAPPDPEPSTEGQSYSTAAGNAAPVEAEVRTGTGDEMSSRTLNSSDSTHPINIELGEISIDQNWVTVPFKNTFSQPVVIAGPPTANGAAPVLVRIRNVSKTGFEIRLQEKDSPNCEHISETLNYMVIDKGIYTLDNGSKLEAGNFTGSSSYEQISLQLLYDFPPVILTQVITQNGPDAVSGRIRNINQYSFEFKQQEIQETAKDSIPETIGYIAWEPGKGKISGFVYEIGMTAKKVTHEWMDLNFETKFQDLPFFIAAMQSYTDSEITTARSQNLSQTTVQIMTEEGESEDSQAWQNEEAVGYFTIGAVAE